ncbi:hypothetical protein DUNSADRAFT_7070 [Dunaliella salina]|uniref:Uncharacterized protein n=1 Tax=Dunaliella salina TaxID=3046 RepID=A0ABQ7H6H9_DUNSA|nr:hypothetical protein DUNSADRAFT_7070 [Dunaliella salina]|eukprot:KAF5842461.1 hypothetical protein DUNSADRAFT_7070 [Dunaliella salina]
MHAFPQASGNAVLQMRALPQASGDGIVHGVSGDFCMEGMPSPSAAALGGDNGGGKDGGGVSRSGRKPKFEPDFWEADKEAGVAVRRSDGRWVVYRHALALFRQLEEELLRVGTHYMECYAHQLHAVGRGAETEELSRQSLLADVWHHEAQFLGARHHLLVAFMSAYRHATDFGIDDLFVQLDLHTQQSVSSSAPASPPGKATDCPDSVFAGSGLYRPEFLPGNKEHASRAGLQQSPGKQADVAANKPQPLLLGARKQLRREMMDICFRRPQLSVDDGYFVGRYIRATETVEMEASLVRQLCLASARVDRESLAGMSRTATMRLYAQRRFPAAAAPAASAAAAENPLRREKGQEMRALPDHASVKDLQGQGCEGFGTGAGGAQCEGGAYNLWQPGLPPGIVYGPFLSNVMPQVQPAHMDDWRGLLRGCALLASVGAAAAILPGIIRKAVDDLANVHQIRHYLELAELRRTVLQYASVEMGVLMQEEVHRAFAAPPKIPKDSKFRSQAGNIGNFEAEQELQDDVALQTSQLNWLLRSHVADNPLVLLGAKTEVACSSKAALEAVLCKEHTVRRLYQSEVLQLVYQAQSRALGKKVVTQELQGVDWASLNVEGQPLKPDQLSDAWIACEPSDVLPPGTLGPEQMGSSICSPMQYAMDLLGHEASGSCVMLAIGRTGVLGGVWRAPPLALAEYSTSMAETLQMLGPCRFGPCRVHTPAHPWLRRCWFVPCVIGPCRYLTLAVAVVV